MTTAAMTKAQEPVGIPDMKVSVRQVFGIDSDLEVPAYSEVDPHVPDIDSDYRFDRATTLAILAGFSHNRRVMVTGYHGTGKSTHIEQVAARLNWPCVRVNLDSHISRIDLVGKDSIVVRDGKQVTEFRDLLAFLDDDGVLADQIDTADVTVEVDAHAGPVQPGGDLLDVGRLAGAMIAGNDHSAVVV